MAFRQRVFRRPHQPTRLAARFMRMKVNEGSAQGEGLGALAPPPPPPPFTHTHTHPHTHTHFCSRWRKPRRKMKFTKFLMPVQPFKALEFQTCPRGSTPTDPLVYECLYIRLNPPPPHLGMRCAVPKCESNSYPLILILSLPRVINFKFSCSLTSNITSHSMKNMAFHSLLRWKMIILPILTTSLIHFSLKGWENVTFWSWEWKSSIEARE